LVFNKSNAYYFLNDSCFKREELLKLIMTYLILSIDRLTRENRDVKGTIINPKENAKMSRASIKRVKSPPI